MIKGWDVALQSMTVGEEAKFSISSQYAYGTKNIGSIIPSNADIEIEMKVISFQTLIYLVIKINLFILVALF